jgi:hypothetical protein
MKFEVNRRLYDTEKAEKVAEVQKSYGEYGKNPDVDWIEILYKKPNDEFFLFGKGGKSSPFGNKDGCRVVVWPIENYNNAKLWVHDNAPKLMDKIFQEKKDDELSVTTVTLSEKAKRNLKRYSAEYGIAVSEILRKYAESLYTD